MRHKIAFSQSLPVMFCEVAFRRIKHFKHLVLIATDYKQA